MTRESRAAIGIGGLDLLYRCVDLGLARAGNDDNGARLDACFCNCKPDSGCTAKHEHALVVELRGVLRSRWRGSCHGI